jgi:hypothetical protein
MSTNRYFQIEEQKLLLEAERITIFTKHNPTIGSYREAILRKYIRQFIPGGLKISTGFVAKNDNSSDLTEGQSRQIDLLIYNQETYQPLLSDENFVVIRPESLVGAIEVKSNLTFYKTYKPNNSKQTDQSFPLGGGHSPAYTWSGTLIDALKNIKACADAYSPRKNGYFSGVISYQSDFSMRNFYAALDNNEIQKQLDITHLRQLPTTICTIGKGIIILSTLDIFESGKQYHNEYESYFNLCEACEDSTQWSLQFFSTFLHNQTGFTHSGKPADSMGLFHASSNKIKIWSHHFDLNSDNM